MSMINEAMNMAREAHKGAKRRDGKDYFDGHVLPVVEYLLWNYNELFPAEALIQGNWGDPEIKDCVIAAAWLHDVPEDTDVTLKDIKQALFPVMVVELVEILTRRKGESYFDYIMRIHNGGMPIHEFCGAFRVGAVAIKLADLNHNINDGLAEGSLKDKYRLAQYILKYFNKP